MTDKYIVMTAAAHMPKSYRRVAVVELDGSGVVPKMISERAHGIKEIVSTWEKLNCGKTERCAYQRALIAAEGLAETLNASAS